MKQVISKKSDIKDKAYPICTESIGETAGTTKRKEWDSGDKARYDRCLEHVSEDEKDMKDPCWKDYEMVGHKKKDGKEVPNCVPKKSNVVFNIFKTAQEEGMHDNDLAQKIQQFENLVSNHDLTYQYSDDPRYYRAGSNSYNQIKKVAEELRELGAYDQAVTIWNSYVDKKLVANARQGFYWQ